MALSIEQELEQPAANDESEIIRIPVAELVAGVFQRRRFLAAAAGIGAVLSICVVLLMPDVFESTAQLMPPDPASISSSSNLTALGGANSFPSGLGGGGSLLSGRTPGQTVIGILASRTAQDDIIKRFDLQKAYRCKFYVDCRRILSKRTKMDEDKKSGIVNITVEDRDRYRARDIADAYVDELNKLLIAGNASTAHLEREFLEGRLKSLKSEVDATSSKLSQFSSRSATFNPQSQGQALMQSATSLESALAMAEGELSALKAQYSDDNVRVREARARVAALQEKLSEMGSTKDRPGAATRNGAEVYPSIRELPILGVTYTDLAQQLAMQENVYETLNKQYELAKVQEAKEIPTIKVLDKPQVPERKSSPHRSVIVILATLCFAFAGIVWVVASKLWELAGDANPLRGFGASVSRLIQNSGTSKPALLAPHK